MSETSICYHKLLHHCPNCSGFLYSNVKEDCQAYLNPNPIDRVNPLMAPKLSPNDLSEKSSGRLGQSWVEMLLNNP